MRLGAGVITKAMIRDCRWVFLEPATAAAIEARQAALAAARAAAREQNAPAQAAALDLGAPLPSARQLVVRLLVSASSTVHADVWKRFAQSQADERGATRERGPRPPRRRGQRRANYSTATGRDPNAPLRVPGRCPTCGKKESDHENPKTMTKTKARCDTIAAARATIVEQLLHGTPTESRPIDEHYLNRP
ncbi:hypothetical protein H9P43_008945 [Blastocladiella emersonii ATCC 22665]|nr:hypothetical protein H9P43_008945 [Blastocladiella emersonii ATCC 22665]